MDGERNKNGIEEGGIETKKPKKTHKSYIQVVDNRGNFGGERNNRNQERVGSVAAYSDTLENTVVRK